MTKRGESTVRDRIRYPEVQKVVCRGVGWLLAPSFGPSQPFYCPVYSILYTIHSILYTVLSILYTIHCIQSTVFILLYTIHCIQSNVYSPQHSVYSIQSTVHSPQRTTLSMLSYATTWCVRGICRTTYPTCMLSHATTRSICIQSTKNSPQPCCRTLQPALCQPVYTELDITSYPVFCIQSTVYQRQCRCR